MAANQLSKGVPDGTLLGQSTSDKVAFYGLTTTTQPAATAQAAPSNTAAVSISATQWGFSTSTQANSVVTCVIQLRSDLVALGLIKGSA